MYSQFLHYFHAIIVCTCTRMNTDMTPEQLTAVVQNQFKASKSLMEFVSVLRKHRHIIKHYPLPVCADMVTASMWVYLDLRCSTLTTLTVAVSETRCVQLVASTC